MQAALLHLDDALFGQSRLRRAVTNGGGRQLHYRDLGPSLRLWARPAALQRLRARLRCALPARLGPLVVLTGSGDFHHVTPLLLERALAAAGNPPVTLLHFDNHPDWVRFSPGAHCGSWVGWAARLPPVARILTIGVCSADMDRPAGKGADLAIVEAGLVEVYAHTARGSDATMLCGRRWPTIESMGEAAFAAFLPSRVETEAVYVTIDKDVLAPDEAGTNWDQGRTSLAFLGTLLKHALEGRQLIGADVLGDWSAPKYGGGFLPALLKRAEASRDQPWRAPAPDRLAGNQVVNLSLLDQLLRAAR